MESRIELPKHKVHRLGSNKASNAPKPAILSLSLLYGRHTHIILFDPYIHPSPMIGFYTHVQVLCYLDSLSLACGGVYRVMDIEIKI